MRVAVQGHSSAGVWMLACGHNRCLPNGRRFTDLRQARTAALEHLAGHARQAGGVPQSVSCRCQAEEHAWHAGRTSCAGQSVRILASDAAGTSWRMAETCQACATAIPRAVVLTTATDNVTDATSAASTMRQVPKPARIPGPHSTAFQEPTTPNYPLWQHSNGEVQRALACPICADQGVTNQRPIPVTTTPSPPSHPAVEADPATRPLLTAHQGQTARQLLSYVTGLPLDTADARLLAAIIAIRAARTGYANLTGQDLKSLRLENPAQAVDRLTDLGWDLPAEILTEDPSTPIVVTVPGLGPDGTLPFGKDARTRVSGWITRVLAAKPLKKAPPHARLTAAGLAAHAHPDGKGLLSDLPGQPPSETLQLLLTVGWLATLDSTTYHLAEAMFRFAPAADTTVQPATHRGDYLSHSQRKEAAQDLLDTSPLPFARWLEEYWCTHHHGPSRDVFIRTHWPHAPLLAAEYALDTLGRTPWISGTAEAYTLRPGPKYQPTRR
ncbi:MAG: hypothetical protein H0T78_04135 [Longispora sp.]|nr:hypothetical protein [Longispora sp. (in: high G+C Gram-positive bacteria)]